MAENLKYSVSGQKIKKISFDDELKQEIYAYLKNTIGNDHKIDTHTVEYLASKGYSPEEVYLRLFPQESDNERLYRDDLGNLRSKLKNADDVADTILTSMLRGEKILIWSDYDADGNTSAHNQAYFFNQVGYKDFDIHIPNRFESGYGLDKQGIEKYAESGHKLMIVYDTGTDMLEEISHAESLGMEVVVFDHHVQKEKGEQNNLVNPNQKGQDEFYKLNNKNLSAATLSGDVQHLLLDALSKIRIKTKKWSVSKRALQDVDKDAIDLVKIIGQFIDVISTDDPHSRYELKRAVKLMNSGKYKFFEDLKGLIDEEELSEDHLSYVIGPIFNAAGRMGDPTLAARVLLLPNKIKLPDAEIEKISQKMRLEEKEISKLNSHKNTKEKIKWLRKTFNKKKKSGEISERKEKIEINKDIKYAEILDNRLEVYERDHKYIFENVITNDVEKEKYKKLKNINERNEFVRQKLLKTMRTINEMRKILSNSVMLEKALEIMDEQDKNFINWIETSENPDVKRLKEKHEKAYQTFKEKYKELKDTKPEIYKYYEQKLFLNSPVKFVFDESFHGGSNGIVASRIKEGLNLPTAVGSESDDKITSSWRSVEGASLVSYILAMRELKVKIGGHPVAAGSTIEKEFAESARAIAIEMMYDDIINTTVAADISYIAELDITELTVEKYKEIYDNLGPFGPGNPKPPILLKNVQVKSNKKFGNELHSKVILGSSSDKHALKSVESVSFFTEAQMFREVINSEKAYTEEFDAVCEPYVDRIFKNGRYEDVVKLRIVQTTEAREVQKEYQIESLVEQDKQRKQAEELKKHKIEKWQKSLMKELKKLEGSNKKKYQKLLETVYNSGLTLYDIETAGLQVKSNDPKVMNAITQISAIKVVKEQISEGKGKKAKTIYSIREFNKFITPETPAFFELQRDVKKGVLYEKYDREKKQSTKRPASFKEDYNRKIHEYNINKEAFAITQTDYIRDLENGGIVTGMTIAGEEVKGAAPAYVALAELAKFSGKNTLIGYNSAMFDNPALLRATSDVLRALDGKEIAENVSEDITIHHSEKTIIKSEKNLKKFKNKYAKTIGEWASYPNVRKSFESPAFSSCMMYAAIVQNGELPKNRADNRFIEYMKDYFGLNEITHTNFDVRDHTKHDALEDTLMTLVIAALQAEWLNEGRNLKKTKNIELPTIQNMFKNILDKYDPELEITTLERPEDEKWLDNYLMIKRRGDISVKFSKEDNPIKQTIKSLDDVYLRSGTEITGRKYGNNYTRIMQQAKGEIILTGRNDLKGDGDAYNISLIKKLKLVDQLIENDLIEKAIFFDSVSKIDLILKGDEPIEDRIIEDVNLASLRFSQQYLLSENNLDNFRENVELIKKFEKIENISAVVLRDDGITLKPNMRNFSNVRFKIPNGTNPRDFSDSFEKHAEYLVRLGNIPGVSNAEKNLFLEEANTVATDLPANDNNSEPDADTGFYGVEFNLADIDQVTMTISNGLLKEVIRQQKYKSNELSGLELDKNDYFVLPNGIKGSLSENKGNITLSGSLEAFSEIGNTIRNTAWLSYRLGRIPGCKSTQLSEGKAYISFDSEDMVKVAEVLANSHITFDMKKGLAIVDMEQLLNDPYSKGMKLKEEIEDFRRNLKRKYPKPPEPFVNNLTGYLRDGMIESFKVFDAKEYNLIYVSTHDHKDVPLPKVYKGTKKTLDRKELADSIDTVSGTVPKYFETNIVAALIGKRNTKKGKERETINKSYGVNIEDIDGRNDYIKISFNPTAKLLKKDVLELNKIMLAGAIRGIRGYKNLNLHENRIVINDIDDVSELSQALLKSQIAFKYHNNKIEIKLKQFEKEGKGKGKKGPKYFQEKIERFSEEIEKAQLNGVSEEYELIQKAIDRNVVNEFEVKRNFTVYFPEIRKSNKVLHKQRFDFYKNDRFIKLEFDNKGELDPIASGTTARDNYIVESMRAALFANRYDEISPQLFFQISKLGGAYLHDADKTKFTKNEEVIFRIPRNKGMKNQEEYLKYFAEVANACQSIYLNKIRRNIQGILSEKCSSNNPDHTFHNDSEEKKKQLNDSIYDSVKNLKPDLLKLADELETQQKIIEGKGYQDYLFPDIQRLNLLTAALLHDEELIREEDIIEGDREEVDKILKDLTETRGDIEKSEMQIERLRKDTEDFLGGKSRITQIPGIIRKISSLMELEIIKKDIFYELQQGKVSEELEEKYINIYSDTYEKSIDDALESLGKAYLGMHNNVRLENIDPYFGYDGEIAIKRGVEKLEKSGLQYKREITRGKNKGEIRDEITPIVSEYTTERPSEVYTEDKNLKYMVGALEKFVDSSMSLNRSYSNMSRMLKSYVELTRNNVTEKFGDPDKVKRIRQSKEAIVGISKKNLIRKAEILQNEGYLDGYKLEARNEGGEEITYGVISLKKNILRDKSSQKDLYKRIAELNKGKQQLPDRPIFVPDTSFLGWSILSHEDLPGNNDYGMLHTVLDMTREGMMEVRLTDMVLAEFLNSAAPVSIDMIAKQDDNGIWQPVYDHKRMIYEKGSEIKEYKKAAERVNFIVDLLNTGNAQIVSTKTAKEYLDKIRDNVKVQRKFMRLFSNHEFQELEGKEFATKTEKNNAVMGFFSNLSDEDLHQTLMSRNDKIKDLIKTIKSEKIRSDTGEISIADHIKELQDTYGRKVEAFVAYQGNDVRFQMNYRINNPYEVYKEKENMVEYNPNLASFDPNTLKIFGRNINLITTIGFYKGIMERAEKLRNKQNTESLYLFSKHENWDKGSMKDIIKSKLSVSADQWGGNIRGIYDKEKDVPIRSIKSQATDEVSHKGPFREFLSKVPDEKIVKLMIDSMIRERDYHQSQIDKHQAKVYEWMSDQSSISKDIQDAKDVLQKLEKKDPSSDIDHLNTDSARKKGGKERE